MTAALDAGRFAERVKAARERAGLSQQALAFASGLSIATVSSVERGARPDPGIATASALANALGGSLDALLR